MPRGPELTKELRKFIYDQYIFFHLSENAIVEKINSDPKLKSKYGEISLAGVHYHVVEIRKQLDNSVDLDAMERYTAEYLRLQNTLESEIDDVDKMIEFIDPKEQPDVYMRAKRLKKELIIDKVRVLQDHELPLTIRKFKKERDRKLKTIKVAPLPMEEQNGSEQGSSE